MAKERKPLSDLGKATRRKNAGKALAARNQYLALGYKNGMNPKKADKLKKSKKLQFTESQIRLEEAPEVSSPPNGDSHIYEIDLKPQYTELMNMIEEVKKPKEKEKEKEKKVYRCGKCNALFEEDATRCPKCGCEFE